MTSSYEQQFLWSLLLTIGVETIVLFAMARYIYRIARSVLPDARLIFCGIICSLATLPYLWFVLPAFVGSKIQLIVTGELAVFLVEAIIIYMVLRPGLLRAMLISLACNLVSIAAGELIRVI